MIHKWLHCDRYGVEESYVKGMAWLERCPLVEDWGCALCHAKTYRKGDYRGVDGTPGRADLIADLSGYRSHTPGIFMRHILEHNLDWRTVLKNAIESFQDRMTLIMFTPESDRDTAPTPGKIPTIHINWQDLRSMLAPFLVREEKVGKQPLRERYNKIDTIFYLEKKA